MRGIAAGALFCSYTALFWSLMMNWTGAPWSIWLMQKTEVYDDFCWSGEGIWQTDMIWGSDKPDKLCSKQREKQTMDAVDKYCGNEIKETWIGDFCGVVKAARILSVLSVGTGFAGTTLGTASRWPWLGHATHMWRLSTLALFFTVLALILNLTLLLLMSFSPFFTEEHFEELGKDNLINFSGLGCKFQSPFSNGLLGLVQTHPLRCIYPGPALVIAFVATTFQLFSSILYVQLRRKLALLVDQFALLASPDVDRHTITAAPAADEVTPLMGFGANAPPPHQAFSSSSSSSSARGYDVRYSLYGAMCRRLDGLRLYERRALSILPPTFAVANGVFLCAWFFRGLQFLVHVQLYPVIPSEDDNKPVGQPMFQLTEQVYTFDPVTSDKDFWQCGGQFISVITAFWLEFFPFLKIVVWLYVWFAPVNEVLRGRVLTWLDYLGKWTLSTMFTLSVMAVAFLFNTYVHIPLPFGPYALCLNVRVQYVPGPGVTWLVISMIWSVFLGNFFLEMHSRAKRWEQIRRQAAADISHGGDNDNDDSSPFAAGDTPYEQMHQGHNHAGRRNGDEFNSRVPFAGLMGELVRRTSWQLSALVDQDGTKEALSERLHSPVSNVKHVFTKRGRAVVWAALMFTWTSTLLASILPALAFTRRGAVGDLLISSQHQHESYSLFSFAMATEEGGGPTNPKWFSGLFICFAFCFPILHVSALFVLWGYRFTASAQRQWFRVMEFLDAWCAMDVYFVAIFVTWLGVNQISRKIVKQVVPGLTELVIDLFPQEEAVFLIEPSLQVGCWFLLLAMVSRFVISYFLMELSAIAIAQRYSGAGAAATLAAAAAAANMSRRSNSAAGLTSEHHVIEPAISPGQNSPSELLMFSPAARYVAVSSLPYATTYGGLPRLLWFNGARAGLMEEVVGLGGGETNRLV